MRKWDRGCVKLDSLTPDDHCVAALPQVTIPESPLSHLINDPNERGDTPVPPYYSGQEIGCYMPHRGDFSVVCGVPLMLTSGIY